jgi:hypothetical protein
MEQTEFVKSGLMTFAHRPRHLGNGRLDVGRY